MGPAAVTGVPMSLRLQKDLASCTGGEHVLLYCLVMPAGLCVDLPLYTVHSPASTASGNADGIQIAEIRAAQELHTHRHVTMHLQVSRDESTSLLVCG